MPSYASIWESNADALPDAPAAAHGSEIHTWREFEDRSARIAAALDAHGVGHDDKVGLFLFNGFEYLEAQFAAFKQRAVPFNVNYRYLAEELAYLWVGEVRHGDRAVVFLQRPEKESIRADRRVGPGHRRNVAVLLL